MPSWPGTPLRTTTSQKSKWIHLPSGNLISTCTTGKAGMNHYSEVIMSAMASQITVVSIIYITVCAGADQRKHQSSVSLGFLRGFHRWRVNSPHKGSVTWKMFPFEDAITTKWPCFVDNKYVSEEKRPFKFHQILSQRFQLDTPAIDFLLHTIWSSTAIEAHFTRNIMMTSSNGNILCVTAPSSGESTGHRWILLTKASDAELWCFQLYHYWWTAIWSTYRESNHEKNFNKSFAFTKVCIERRFPCHRLQRKPLVSDPGMHRGTRGYARAHVQWCMSGSLNRGDGENVPGIPGARATRNFAYLVRGPYIRHRRALGITVSFVCSVNDYQVLQSIGSRFFATVYHTGRVQWYFPLLAVTLCSISNW